MWSLKILGWSLTITIIVVAHYLPNHHLNPQSQKILCVKYEVNIHRRNIKNQNNCVKKASLPIKCSLILLFCLHYPKLDCGWTNSKLPIALAPHWINSKRVFILTKNQARIFRFIFLDEQNLTLLLLPLFVQELSWSYNERSRPSSICAYMVINILEHRNAWICTLILKWSLKWKTDLCLVIQCVCLSTLTRCPGMSQYIA